ncbi:hypothetical protein Bca4012_019033 [Brassica carinata]
MDTEGGASEADLYTLSQRRTKSLKSFIGRFNAIVSCVKVSDKIAITALVNPLWYESELCKYLKLNKPHTLEDALQQPNLFVELEEEKETMAKKHATTNVVVIKEKPKEECGESRHRSETERKQEEGDQKAQNFHISDTQRSPR